MVNSINSMPDQEFSILVSCHYWKVVQQHRIIKNILMQSRTINGVSANVLWLTFRSMLLPALAIVYQLRCG